MTIIFLTSEFIIVKMKHEKSLIFSCFSLKKKNKTLFVCLFNRRPKNRIFDHFPGMVSIIADFIILIIRYKIMASNIICYQQ